MSEYGVGKWGARYGRDLGRRGGMERGVSGRRVVGVACYVSSVTGSGGGGGPLTSCAPRNAGVNQYVRRGCLHEVCRGVTPLHERINGKEREKPYGRGKGVLGRFANSLRAVRQSPVEMRLQ